MPGVIAVNLLPAFGSWLLGPGFRSGVVIRVSTANRRGVAQRSAARWIDALQLVRNPSASAIAVQPPIQRHHFARHGRFSIVRTLLSAIAEGGGNTCGSKSRLDQTVRWARRNSQAAGRAIPKNAEALRH